MLNLRTMLPVCSAVPSCSHSQISLHVGRAFYPLQKVLEGRHIFEGRAFFWNQDGIHAQDISFGTHASKCVHSLIVEKPDRLGSLDSSIFSPYPNGLDDIVRGFSKECIESEPEDWYYSTREITGLYPIAEDLKDVKTSKLSGPSMLPDDLGNDIADYISSRSVTAETMVSPDIEPPPAVSPSGDALQDLPNSLDQSSNGLSGLASSGSFLLPNATETTLTDSPAPVSDTFEVANKGILDLKESVNHLVSGITESINTSIVENSKLQGSNELTGYSSVLKENVYRAGTSAIDILRQVIITVEDSLANAATFVVYSYGSAKSLLPPDVRDVLDLSEEKTLQILSPVGAAFQQAYIIIENFERNLGLDPNDPILPFILIFGSSATIGVSYWLSKYGGYSGDLAPEITLELLKGEENAVLIDVRPKDLRERDGVPDLRREARAKYASVTLPEIDGSIKKQLKRGREIDDAITAVVIRNLKIVKDESKVIIMDANGGQSKAIARSLRKLGVKKPYMVQGGFQSWAKKGLRIKELKPETTLTVLNEEAQAILEDIKPTPALVIGYGLGVSAAVYALLEWEKTLQIIGLIGLGQSLYRRVASYEDSKDFKQDVRLLLAPVRLGAQAFSWAARKIEPNKVGLPTSPSSTAVQDRVLQAAAKHESQPSDAEEAQGLPQESLAQTNENLDLSEA
ncbi:Calcium sensing receptor, chloroplastic [Cocos nucifera]|uniref:Calcium sensing receptor, chloroplastic n=1 Tax=Cocos nucifera TaxID=13894 RepID=A0A8K0N970_COCNU|nr:Calcium sensing receptor, chloroplastic [Cocos nucifera]